MKKIWPTFALFIVAVLVGCVRSDRATDRENPYAVSHRLRDVESPIGNILIVTRIDDERYEGSAVLRETLVKLLRDCKVNAQVIATPMIRPNLNLASMPDDEKKYSEEIANQIIEMKPEYIMNIIQTGWMEKPRDLLDIALERKPSMLDASYSISVIYKKDMGKVWSIDVAHSSSFRPTGSGLARYLVNAFVRDGIMRPCDNE